MHQILKTNLHVKTHFSTSEYGAKPISDQDLDVITGGSIGGQGEAHRLLDEYLASMQILSQRTDLSDEAKSLLRSSWTAELTRKIREAATIGQS